MEEEEELEAEVKKQRKMTASDVGQLAATMRASGSSKLWYDGHGQEDPEDRRQAVMLNFGDAVAAHGEGNLLQGQGAMADLDLANLREVKLPAASAAATSDLESGGAPAKEEPVEESMEARLGRNQACSASKLQEAQHKHEHEQNTLQEAMAASQSSFMTKRNRWGRNMETTYRKLELDVQNEIQLCEAALLEFGSKEELTIFARELSLLKSRAYVLNLVDGHPCQDEKAAEQALADHLRSYTSKDATSSTSASISGPGESDARRLANAPPCFGWENLVPLAFLKSKSALPQDVESQTELTTFGQALAKHTSAINHLVKSMKTSLGDLYGARVGRRQELQKRKADAVREEAKRQKMMNSDDRSQSRSHDDARQVDGAPGPFDWQPGQDHKIKVMPLDDFRRCSAAALESPVLVTGVPLLATLIKEDNIQKKEVSDGWSTFRAHPEMSRAQLRQKILDEGLAINVKSAMVGALPPMVNNTVPADVGLAQQVDAFLTPDIWLRAAGTESANLESGVAACVRYNFAGSRKVVLTRFSRAGQHVRTLKGPRALRQPISALMTTTWLQSAKPLDIEQAIQASVEIWGGTIGPGEMLYLPSGYIKIERTMGEESCGLRMGWLFRQERGAVPEMKAIVADLLTMGRKNALVNAPLAIKESELPAPGALARTAARKES